MDILSCTRIVAVLYEAHHAGHKRNRLTHQIRAQVSHMAHKLSVSNVSPINEIWQDKTKKPYPIRSVRCADDCSIEWTLITHSRADRSDLVSQMQLQVI